jgi:hypothetical protein
MSLVSDRDRVHGSRYLLRRAPECDFHGQGAAWLTLTALNWQLLLN